MDNFTNNAIDIGSLPQFENVNFQSISTRYLTKTLFQNFLLLCLALIGWAALFYFNVNQIVTLAIMIAIALFFIFKFWNTFMLQKKYGYALREKDLLFKRGYLIRKTTVVPFNRIQHASVSQDLLDKYFKISTLKVFTAGGSGSDIVIPGLTTELALRLKEGLAVKLTENGL